MNASTLIELRILVERAIRPVRASTARKRKMREELLAHVSDAFDEECKQLRDERAALQRTVSRFGNPDEVTKELQATVSASDNIARFLEGRPGESMLRTALRFACAQAAMGLVIVGVAALSAVWILDWSREALMTVGAGFDIWPALLRTLVVLSAIAVLFYWIEASLERAAPLADSPRLGLIRPFTSAWRMPGVRIAMIVGGLSLYLLFLVLNVGSKWPAKPLGLVHVRLILGEVPPMAFKAAVAVLGTWFLARHADQRRRYHQEWASLPIE